jgi:hypothetical protein
VAELQDYFDPLDEVESLLRTAQHYVRPSEDLRPRVLEAARAERGERRTLLWMGQMAAFVALLVGLATSLLDLPAATAVRTPITIQSLAPVLSKVEPTVTHADPSWGMVESFTELRRRQAELIRRAL